MKWKKVISGILSYVMVISSMASATPLSAVAGEVSKTRAGDAVAGSPEIIYSAPSEGAAPTGPVMKSNELSVVATEDMIVDNNADVEGVGSIQYKNGGWGFNHRYRSRSNTDAFDIYGDKMPMAITFRLYMPKAPTSKFYLFGKMVEGGDPEQQYTLQMKEDHMEVWSHGGVTDKSDRSKWGGMASFYYNEVEDFFNGWHDILIVYDDENLFHMIYVDGKQGRFQTADGSGNPQDANGDKYVKLEHKNAPFTLGTSEFINMGGLVSDFKVYSGANMTEEQKSKVVLTEETLATAHIQIYEALKEVEPVARIGLEGPEVTEETQWVYRDGEGENITLQSPETFKCGTEYEAMSTMIAPENYVFPNTEMFEETVLEHVDAGWKSGVTKTADVIEDGKAVRISVKYPAMQCNVKDITLVSGNDVAVGEELQLRVNTRVLGDDESHNIPKNFEYEYKIIEGEEYISLTPSGKITGKAVGKARIAITALPEGNSNIAFTKNFSMNVISSASKVSPSMVFTKPVANQTIQSASVTPDRVLLDVDEDATLVKKIDGNVVVEKENQYGFNGKYESESGEGGYNVSGANSMIIASMDLFVSQLPSSGSATIFAKAGSGANNQYTFHLKSDRKLELWSYNGGTYSDNRYMCPDSFLNKWHEIIVLFDSSRTIGIYLDGKRVDGGGAGCSANLPSRTDLKFFVGSQELRNIGGSINNFRFYSSEDMTDTERLAAVRDGYSYDSVKELLRATEPVAKLVVNQEDAVTKWSEIGSDEVLGENATFEESQIYNPGNNQEGYVATTTMTLPGGFEFIDDLDTIRDQITTGAGEGEVTDVRVNLSSDKKTLVVRVYYGQALEIDSGSIKTGTYGALTADTAITGPEITPDEGAHYTVASAWTENGIAAKEGANFTDLNVNSYVVSTVYTATGGYSFKQDAVETVKQKISDSKAANVAVDVKLSEDEKILTVTAAYEVNIALNRKVTAEEWATGSNVENGAQSIVDGIDENNKYWASVEMIDGSGNDTTRNAELIIDLKAEESEISSIFASYQAKAWATDYTISTSDTIDGGWTEVAHIVKENKDSNADADRTDTITASDENKKLKSTKLKRYVRFFYDKMNTFATGLCKITVREIKITGVRKNLFHTVTFNTNGGTPANITQDVLTNKRVVRPESNPTKENLTFANWYADETLQTEYDFDANRITEPVTIYAGWNAVVTFMRNDKTETVEGTKKVIAGTVIEKPTPANRVGYTFSGDWYDNAACTGTAFDFTNPINVNTTLYAKWTPEKRTVTFDSKGGSAVESAVVDYDSALKQPANPTHSEGKTFLGWYMNEEYTTRYNFASPVTENFTLYARWGSAEDKVTVTFDSQGGTAVDSQEFVKGESANVPSEPTKTGYTFIGWFENAEGTGTAFDFSTAINENKTLYAKWEKDPIALTGITLQPNAHKFEAIGETKDFTVTFAPADADNKEVKWTSNKVGIVEIKPSQDGATATIKALKEGSATITVTAKSDSKVKATASITVKVPEVPVIKKVTVTFDSKEGTPVDEITVDENTPIEAPEDPTRDGYTFGGWFTDEEYENAYDFASPVTENITLYAKWTEKQMTPDEPAPKPPTGGDNKPGGTDPGTTNPGGNNQNVVTPPKKGEKLVVGEYSIEVLDPDKRTIAIDKGMASKKAKVKIPASIQVNNVKFTVIGIAKGAFKNNKKITQVTIPSSVKSIGSQSFMGCKKLKKIIVQGKTLKIGKNSLKGTSPKLKISAKKMSKKQRTTLQKNAIKQGKNKKVKVTK